MPDFQAMPALATESPNLTEADLPTQLGDLRAEIDRIDEALHELLMRRARVVERVADLGRIGKIPFRPGREAAIIRRLLARHSGHLPARAIVRLWREMFAANIAIESRFLIAVCEAGPGDGMVQLAREHFGALTPLRVAASPAETLAWLVAGEATAAVLPMPGSSGGGWWATFRDNRGSAPRVVARLPFWDCPRAEGAVSAQALALAAAPPDESGADRSLVAVDLPVTGRLLDQDGRGRALIEIDGFLVEGDRRLDALSGAVLLGSYAIPIEHDTP